MRGIEPRDVSFELDGVRHWAAIYGESAPRPGVLVLHTARGLTTHERAIARRLEQSGFTAMTVRYSARTSGEVVRDEPACRRIDRICTTAFDLLRSDRAVDPTRVGILGLSLGGYFAVRLAASGEPVSLVVWYGVYPSALPRMRQLRGPLLIVQGTLDADGFIQAATQAAAQAPGQIELLSCPGLLHQFDLFQPLSRGSQIAWQRTVEFLMLGPRRPNHRHQ